MILLFKINISLICYNKKLSMMVRYCSYNITRSEGGVKKNTENIANQSTCMVSAPPMMMGGGIILQGQCGGGCAFSYGQWGDSFIWDESQLGISLGGLQYQFLAQLASAGPKSVVNLTNCHREVCRIKFY